MHGSQRHRSLDRLLERRTFLRGAGVTMALPWLESTARAAAPPKRIAVLFMGNGISPASWWAKGAGGAMELGPSLAPLAPFRARLNVVGGLFNRAATGVGIHPGMTGNLLSGAPLQKGAELKGGVSMDQVLATHVGQETAQPSLVLGCEQPTTGYHETNFSLAYSSHISWQSPTSPVPIEQYPSLAFDSLFDARTGRRDNSILDRVRQQAAALQAQVSATDRAKVDEYLTSVREVEKRIQGSRRAGPAPTVPMKRPADGMPEDIREHMRAMLDILAIAFQTDRTRVATLLLSRDLSGLTYPFLGIRQAHHGVSHRDLSEDYQKITRFHVEQLAYLAGRLASMREGAGTVLDGSCVMFVSNMWSGSRHDARKLPVLLLGGLGGTLKTGRVLDYGDRGDDRRKLCSLYLSLMDRMGVRLDRFGDADQRLAEI